MLFDTSPGAYSSSVNGTTLEETSPPANLLSLEVRGNRFEAIILSYFLRLEYKPHIWQKPQQKTIKFNPKKAIPAYKLGPSSKNFLSIAFPAYLKYWAVVFGHVDVLCVLFIKVLRLVWF